MAEIVRLEQVGKRYSTQWVLKDLDLVIRSNEQWVIQGASGSGKTTLIQLLGLLDRPSAGQLYFQGHNTVSVSEAVQAKWRNQHIGFVFQQFYLLPELTVVDNVNIPAQIAGKARSEWNGAALLAQVGLKGKEQAYPASLSGGEQQRVAIARALINKPLMVLADEPTGSLDPALGLEMMQMMQLMCQTHQAAFVLVTHNDQLARQIDGHTMYL